MEEESEQGKERKRALGLHCSNNLYNWSFRQITLEFCTLFAYYLH